MLERSRHQIESVLAPNRIRASTKSNRCRLGFEPGLAQTQAQASSDWALLLDRSDFAANGTRTTRFEVAPSVGKRSPLVAHRVSPGGTFDFPWWHFAPFVIP